MNTKYIYLDKEQAKQGTALVFGVFDKPLSNYQQYYENKACLFIGDNLPHFITYLESENIIREATEEEKLKRNQRELSENEILNNDGKIEAYDPYSQKIINNEIIDKTRGDFINEGIITLETEKEKARFERDKQFKSLDLYDKAVLRGDIIETEEMKKERDLFRKKWLELPNSYTDINISIEKSYPEIPQQIMYFN